MTQASGKNGAKRRFSWFRFYNEALDDPKVQKLCPSLFKTWINLLCLASMNDGRLPSVDDIAFRLRISVQDAQQQVDELILSGLLDIEPDKVLSPHKWNERQFPSDSSTERTKKYRQKKRERHSDGARDDDVTVQRRVESEEDLDKKTVSLSEQEAARETGDRAKQFSKLNLKFDRGDSGLEKLAKRAEGFELPVAELRAKTARASRGNPAGYFRELCIEQLRNKIPAVPDRTLGEALDGSARAFTVVCGALMQLAEARQ